MGKSPKEISADAGYCSEASPAALKDRNISAYIASSHARRPTIGGKVTSARQEDFMAHPTAAAIKFLAVLDNAEYVLAILMAAAQAYDFLGSPAAPRAADTDAIYSFVRTGVAHYADDRPLGLDMSTDPRHGLSFFRGDSRRIRLGYFEAEQIDWHRGASA